MANLSQEYAKILLPGTVFITVAGALGIVGNIIVIILYWSKIEDENGDRYFIPVLAVVDMLGSITMTIYNLMDNYFFFDYPSDTLCQWLTFSMMLSGLFSPTLLLIIAVQRYKKVCQPSERQFTLKCRRCTIFLSVLISAIFIAPYLLFSGTSTTTMEFQGQNVTGTFCKVLDNTKFPGKTFSRIGLIHLGCICMLLAAILITLVVLYALIAVKLRKAFQVLGTEQEPLRPRETEPLNRYGDKEVQTRFNLMYALIVIVYIISFVPTAVTLILVYVGVKYLELPNSALVAWIIFARFAIVNHFINPLIYTFFDAKFRAALGLICKIKCMSQNSHEMSIPS
ncbi:orexin receptor type 2-like [Crassostrea virginica]